MKKTVKKKLVLAKETVRDLEVNTLRQAVGAMYNNSLQCPSTSNFEACLPYLTSIFC